jgi:hypothetical protein
MMTTGSTFAANTHLHQSIGKLLRGAGRPAAPARRSRAG